MSENNASSAALSPGAQAEQNGFAARMQLSMVGGVLLVSSLYMKKQPRWRVFFFVKNRPSLFLPLYKAAATFFPLKRKKKVI